jgi:hypothetical protein
MNSPIQMNAASYRLLKERLEAEFPEADDETLHDTLDGLTNLREMLAALVRSYLDDRAFATGLKTRLDDMQVRLARYEQRADKKKAVVSEVMEFAELRKVTEPDFTLFLRAKPPGVIVTDETAVPDSFWLPQPPKLDRQGLKDALKRGQPVPGATLDNASQTVTVRTK